MDYFVMTTHNKTTNKPLRIYYYNLATEFVINDSSMELATHLHHFKKEAMEECIKDRLISDPEEFVCKIGRMSLKNINKTYGSAARLFSIDPPKDHSKAYNKDAGNEIIPIGFVPDDYNGNGIKAKHINTSSK